MWRVCVWQHHTRGGEGGVYSLPGSQRAAEGGGGRRKGVAPTSHLVGKCLHHSIVPTAQNSMEASTLPVPVLLYTWLEAACRCRRDRTAPPAPPPLQGEGHRPPNRHHSCIVNAAQWDLQLQPARTPVLHSLGHRRCQLGIEGVGDVQRILTLAAAQAATAASHPPP